MSFVGYKVWGQIGDIHFFVFCRSLAAAIKQRKQTPRPHVQFMHQLCLPKPSSS